MFIAALEFMLRRSREIVLRKQSSQWYMVKRVRRPAIVGPVSS